MSHESIDGIMNTAVTACPVVYSFCVVLDCSRYLRSRLIAIVDTCIWWFPIYINHTSLTLSFLPHGFVFHSCVNSHTPRYTHTTHAPSLLMLPINTPHLSLCLVNFVLFLSCETQNFFWFCLHSHLVFVMISEPCHDKTFIDPRREIQRHEVDKFKVTTI